MFTHLQRRGIPVKSRIRTRKNEHFICRFTFGF